MSHDELDANKNTGIVTRYKTTHHTHMKTSVSLSPLHPSAMSNFHGDSALSAWGVSCQSPPKTLPPEVRLTPGSAKEPPRRARRRQGLKLPQRAPAMIHGSSVGKREKQKITGKELKRPKALFQIGKKISHSQKYFTFTCTEGCVLGAPCPTY